MCGTWLCLMCESYNVVRLNGHSFPEFLHVNMCAFEFSHSYCPLISICIFDLFISAYILLEKKSSAAAMELPLRSSTSVALKAQGDETTSIYILISYCN